MTGPLPPGQFDGQVYVDFYKVKWVFMAATQCWRREGKVDAFPVANGTNIGLLSAKLKYLLDTVPNKGGGFALITKPLLTKRSRRNPDGVLFGDIQLVSDSLTIDCVDADGSKIGDACKKVTFKEYDRQPPGFDINFSDSFLDAICVEVPGGPGATGKDGPKGEPGDDGTGDGPVGLKGLSGKDATSASKFTAVQIIDVDDIFDTAVAKLDLDATNGKLFVTKAKMALPTDADAADQLIVAQIARQVSFTDCFDYEIKKVPCRFDDDFDVLDPLIAYYPATFNPASIDGTQSYQPVRARLSNLVDNIISFYKKKLQEASDTYDIEVATFIQNKDNEARKVLDQLGDRLAECENITYLEYCVGIEGECNAPPPPPVTAGGPATGQIAGNDPNCQPLLDIMFCTDVAASSCQTLGEVEVTGSQAPVLSFPSPDPGKTISQNPPTTGLHSQAEILASFKPYEALFVAAINKSFIVYPKTQVMFSGSTPLFPAGHYALIYESGAFRQEQRTDAERAGIDPNFAINGAFQNFFVGGEGPNLQAEMCLLEPGGSGCVMQTTKFVNTQCGIEIGFAPADYKNLIPSDYFSKHAFNLNDESSRNAYVLPNTRVDYVGLSDAIIAEESKISWQQFIVLPEASTSDASAMQAAYLNAILARRSARLISNIPGFIFIRVKAATGFISPVSTFVMPPVYPQGSLGGGFPLFDSSFNKVAFLPQSGRGVDFVNARPIIEGTVKFKVMSVDCKMRSQPVTPITGATGVPGGSGTGADPNPIDTPVDNLGNEQSAGAAP